MGVSSYLAGYLPSAAHCPVPRHKQYLPGDYKPPEFHLHSTKCPEHNRNARPVLPACLTIEPGWGQMVPSIPWAPGEHLGGAGMFPLSLSKVGKQAQLIVFRGKVFGFLSVSGMDRFQHFCWRCCHEAKCLWQPDFTGKSPAKGLGSKHSRHHYQGKKLK